MGTGVYGPSTKISVDLSKSSTIFQAELEAIRIHRVSGGRRAFRATLQYSQIVITALYNSERKSLLVRASCDQNKS